MKCENTAKAPLEVTIKSCLPGKLCKGSGTPFFNKHPRSAAGEQSRDRKQMEKSAMKGNVSISPPSLNKHVQGHGSLCQTAQTEANAC